MPASMDSPSPKRLRSKNEDESADKDRISCLPDDVVGSILSLLRSREAQATCLLSRRWRHLSTCQVTNLDFDWSDLLDEMKGNPELAEKERARYVAWVDNVLHRHSEGFHLRRFALYFDLNISYKSHIDRWIRFALTKRVKILKLDFEPVCVKDLRRDCDPSRLPYPLGHEILMDVDIGCSRRAPGQSNFGWNSSSSWHVEFKYLEELYLNRVSVEEELIEQLLANCPVLERLVLEHSPTLNRLRVSGQSLKLKHLCIAYCKDLDRVEIYDTGLVSFTFMGCEIPVFGQAPATI
ncbi:F-box/LRR-repeat protein At3g59200 [Eucalyptus grandis]|uniref:F-box/LRR-repeat protein At3g59200 n=1 Tax=Eucalyptus grandis TaxID=71139 RepID=UPI00192F0A9D|nr:F-box/LRR-repeat protein At3g59200 [Eucalyptus grandis]